MVGVRREENIGEGGRGEERKIERRRGCPSMSGEERSGCRRGGERSGCRRGGERSGEEGMS